MEVGYITKTGATRHAPVPADQKEIPAELSRLTGNVSNLIEQIDMMTSQLNAVVIPQPISDANKCGLASACSSEIGAQISTQSALVADVARRIQILRDSLAV